MWTEAVTFPGGAQRELVKHRSFQKIRVKIWRMPFVVKWSWKNKLVVVCRSEEAEKCSTQVWDDNRPAGFDSQLKQKLRYFLLHSTKWRRNRTSTDFQFYPLNFNKLARLEEEEEEEQCVETRRFENKVLVRLLSGNERKSSRAQCKRTSSVWVNDQDPDGWTHLPN